MDGKLLDSANKSGFFFQSAVEHAVRSSRHAHEWRVLASEHYWQDKATGQAGNADLVLQWAAFHYVIECKRRLDTTWIFPIAKEAPEETDKVRCRWYYSPKVSNVGDVTMPLASAQSHDCIMVGPKDRDGRLLETVARTLLMATDAIAEESFAIDSRTRKYLHVGCFQAVIVTSADLMVVRYDPGQVPLDKGMLPASAAGAAQPVPYVRFRKSLASALTSDAEPRDLADSADDRERTVWVVSATALVPKQACCDTT
jgi:hypothetical protein